jgi:hypothetical protein
MKSLIISFVGALAIGAGGATGVAFQRSKAAAVVAAAALQAKADSIKLVDSTHPAERVIGDAPDSTAAAHDSVAAHVDSAKAPAVEHKDAAPDATKDSPAPATPTPATPASKTAPAPKQQGAALPMPHGGDSVATLSEKRIAKAFATMPPKDAAKVFEVMSDPDVASILASLTDKESAAILAKLPPQRVAAISKMSLNASRRGIK